MASMRVTSLVTWAWMWLSCLDILLQCSADLKGRVGTTSKTDKIVNKNYTDTEIIEKLLTRCIPNTDTNIKLKPNELPCYNPQEPPNLLKPTEVKLGMYICSVYSISEQAMEYSMSFYFRQSWIDPRLNYSRFDSSPKRRVKMNDEILKQIWIPDTFFRNEKDARFHTVSVPNKLLRLNENTGVVWYVAKISATLSCMMKLHNYPMDSQTCSILFESFGYTMDVMYFAWLDTPVEIAEGLSLPQFQLNEHILFDCSQNYTAGAFPCQEIRFILKRDIGFFLIQVYMPTMLVVILSWVSFWINVEASPARVSLGLLTVLTMTTQSTGVNQSMPRVSYIKAIDVWMSCCLMFVFSGLVEYAIVNVLSRKKPRPKLVSRASFPLRLLDRTQGGGGVGYGGVAGNNGGHFGSMAGKQANSVEITMGPSGIAAAPAKPAEMIDGKTRAQNVDKMARKVFPISFLLFNLFYWTYYGLPYSFNQDSST